MAYAIQSNTIEIFEVFDLEGNLMSAENGDTFFWSWSEAEAFAMTLGEPDVSAG